NAFLLAFAQTFGELPLEEALDANRENDEEHPVAGFGACLLRAYYDHSAEADDLIRAHLRGWTMERIPRVSLTVLRLAIAEMLDGAEHKPGVAINEAVELAKKYGAEEDYQFVNGLLGSVARESGLADEDDGAPQEEPAQPRAIHWVLIPATMRPLLLILTQPGRVFAQNSAFCR